jgi:NAD(P)-dependent dehydrogenase (short-subunit alcohol dehydrogenase family)
MMLLEGDAIVLAGATGRVGGATLATLVAEGANVLVVSREAARAQATIAQTLAPELRGRAHAFAANLTLPEPAAAAIEAARGHFGRVDAVVSLAGGGYHFAPLVDSTAGELQASLDGNLLANYNLMLPALRAMLGQAPRPGARSRGRLVAVSAGSSWDPQPRFALMGMAKAGLNVLMLAIAREHKPDGIVANAVRLGSVATEAALASMSDEEFTAAVQPQEVADVLAFLASDRASGINGALVDVNAREVD